MRDETWERSALCRRLPSYQYLFFSDDKREIAAAKAICAGCSVRESCLAQALLTKEQFDVWGGYDATERRSMRRRMRMVG